MINVYELPVPTVTQELRPVGDLLANAIILATLMDWIPMFAAIVSLIWGVMRCYETYLDIRKKKGQINLPVSTTTVAIETPHPDAPGQTPIATGIIAVEVVPQKEKTDGNS